jgi:hypothetical protein
MSYWVAEQSWGLTIRICRSEAIPHPTMHMPHNKQELVSTLFDLQQSCERIVEIVCRYQQDSHHTL